jgi:hypothetical protein
MPWAAHSLANPLLPATLMARTIANPGAADPRPPVRGPPTGRVTAPGDRGDRPSTAPGVPGAGGSGKMGRHGVD